MAVMTGLSGNEMYCLHQKGLQAGDLVIGNSVFSVGVIGSLGSGLKTLAGGEVTQITSVIHEGRLKSYERMVVEARKHGGIGITGVSNELVLHGGNVEFLSIGSCVHQEGASTGAACLLLIGGWSGAILPDRCRFPAHKICIWKRCLLDWSRRRNRWSIQEPAARRDTAVLRNIQQNPSPCTGANSK